MAAHSYGGTTFYDSLDEACNASKWGIAIGRLYVEHKGQRIEAEIRKRAGGNAWIQFKGSAIRIRKATSREVDSVRRWWAQA